MESKKGQKEEIPKCKYCGKQMQYNKLSEEYECNEPKCIVKRMCSDAIAEINNVCIGAGIRHMGSPPIPGWFVAHYIKK